MREKPRVADELIAAQLGSAYGLEASDVTFLPLGADADTAVYRLAASEESYFLKMRGGKLDEAGLVVPRLLRERGVRSVVPPIPTRSGKLWTRLGRWSLVLHPFVEGRDGYADAMTDEQWEELGAALRALHGTDPPAEVRRETFAPPWPARLRDWMARIERERFADPEADAAAALVRADRARIAALAARLEALGAEIGACAPALVLCHGDMHAGNVLLGADGALYVVDWDTLIVAPPECDMALIGAPWAGPPALDAFRRGYGPSDPDPATLEYYRLHRTVEDFAVTCDVVFGGPPGGANWRHELELLTRLLVPAAASTPATTLA